MHISEDDPFHKDETFPPLKLREEDATSKFTEATNGSKTRHGKARQQGELGAEDAATREAPLLVLPSKPASRHLSAPTGFVLPSPAPFPISLDPPLSFLGVLHSALGSPTLPACLSVQDMALLFV